MARVKFQHSEDNNALTLEETTRGKHQLIAGVGGWHFAYFEDTAQLRALARAILREVPARRKRGG